MGKTLVKLHSEKSRNLDTPSSAKVRISHERLSVTRKIQKNSTAPVTSSFSGKEVKEEKERDVNGNEAAASASNLRFYLELKGQRRIPAGTELTIRYNSVFEVTCNAILFCQDFQVP